MGRAGPTAQRRGRRSSWIPGRSPASGRSDSPDAAQLMLLTAFVLVIAFVALAGMVSRVTQLPAETRQSAERPILTESRSVVNGLEEMIDQLVSVHGIDDPANNPDGDDVEALAFDVNDAVAHLDHLQSARGFGFEASPLVCTDRGDDGSGTTNRVRLWMEFTLRSTETRVVRSVSVEIDGVATTVNGNPCPDPGFAFEDANGDLLFDAADGDQQIGVDVPGEVTDGVHEAQPGFGLVIPASVNGGLISATPPEADSDFPAGIIFEGHGPTLIAVDVTNARDTGKPDNVNIIADSGDIWLAGVTLTVSHGNAGIYIQGTAGTHLERATFSSTTGGSCFALTSGDETDTLYVAGVDIGTDDELDPGGADRIVGTPADGTVVPNCDET